MFVHASSNPTKVLINHWVSQSREEEFSWGRNTFGMTVHAIALILPELLRWEVTFSIRSGIPMYILKELLLCLSQTSDMFSKHQWTWRSRQFFKTPFFKLLYCFFIFLFSFPSMFYDVHSVISIHLHPWSMNHWQVEQSMKRRTWKMSWLPSIVVEMTAKS